MAVVRIKDFGGEVPIQGVRNLPNSSAAQSVNTWLYSGELRGLHPNVNLRGTASTTQKVFRIPLGTVGGDPANPTLVPPPSYLGDSTWLEFDDPNTDIIRGPLVADSFKRWYFCSPTTGLRVNSYARMQAGSSSFKAGVPPPTATLGISVSGGVATSNVTRAYAYTFINIWGEESGPSLAVTAAGKPDGTWAISNIADPGGSVFTDYVGFQNKKLYRTITSASGTTTYFLVATIASGTTTYSDTTADSVLSGNLQFDNANGLLPPADIKGIIAMPNGFFVGFSDTNVYFSEPYKAHSWPVEYMVSTEFPIVGLGVYGQTCALITQGYPCLLQGITPDTTALSKTNVIEPCLSRGSIVSTNDGVFYASPNGLVSVSPNGVINTTQSLITKEEWVRSFSPSYIRACRYQQGYLALRAIPSLSDRTAFYLDLSALNVAVNELSEFSNGVIVQTDIWSGEVFSIKNHTVYHHDPSDSTFFLPVRWLSKEFQYVFPENFGCYALYWDAAKFDATSADATYILPQGVAAHLRVFADRNLVYDADVPFNQLPNRLPSGFKATIWQFELTARAPIFELDVASTMKELRRV